MEELKIGCWGMKGRFDGQFAEETVNKNKSSNYVKSLTRDTSFPHIFSHIFLIYPNPIERVLAHYVLIPKNWFSRVRYSCCPRKWSSLVHGRTENPVASVASALHASFSSYGGRMPAYFMSKQTSVPVACAATNPVALPFGVTSQACARLGKISRGYSNLKL